MPLPEWFDWTAGVASIAGLGYAWWASHQAGGAKVAAERAEKSVHLRNAEVDFGSLARMAKELHGYVEGGRMAEARLRTTDLRSELALAIPNHKTFLGTQLNLVKEKQIDLVLVANGLNRGSDTLTRSEKIRLLGITGAILEVLAGQCGELRSSVERGVTNG
jgi:hypothetical protein